MSFLSHSFYLESIIRKSFFPMQLFKPNNNPDLPARLRRTMTSTVFELVHAVILLGIVVMTYMLWVDAPDRVPTHFDLHGNPNGYSDKSVFWIMAGAAVISTLVLDITSYFPKQMNMPFSLQTERQCYMVNTLMHISAIFAQLLFAYLIYMFSEGEQAAVIGMPIVLGLVSVELILIAVFSYLVRKAGPVSK